MPATAGTIGEALSAATDALRAVGVDSPRLDAEVLLAEAGGEDRARLAADPDRAIDSAAGRRFGEMVRRRLTREPVAYVTGRRGFRRLELEVDRRVLIPRPETELLVELALEMRPRAVLDIGTGSGAIALAVADELPECRVTATDTSAAALEVARANAKRLGLAGRIEFVEGTLPTGPGEPVTLGAGSSPDGSEFDLVLANLPYVAEADWPSLEPEVTEWEPREALLAGPDGLDAYRALIPVLRKRLCPRIAGTKAFAVGLEVGEGQARAVGELLRDGGFAEVETRRDLAGVERLVVGRRPGGEK